MVILAMKKIILLTLMSFTSLTINSKNIDSIKGIIETSGKVPSGTLYIFAKKFNSKMPMPLAVIKVPNPKFPYKFELSKKNQMIPSIPFQGPFKVTARISPNGTAMDKSGIEVSTIKKVEIGDSNIKLILKN